MQNAPRDLESIARRGSPLSRMAARIPTYLADVKENPTWLPMFLLARTMPARKAHWRTAAKVGSEPAKPSMFAGVDREQVAAGLKADGIFPGLVLPEAIHSEIAAFAKATPCFGNFDRKLEFLAGEHAAAEARFGKALLSGHHFERALDCPAVTAVQQDPLLADVAKLYLGGEAQMITTRVWWSFPTPGASEADRHLASLDKYHFDLDDWRMLKFFFYLVDVDAGNGPHVFVRGSHAKRRMKHQLTLLVGHPAEEVLGYYGAENAMTLTGKAGFGFAEDPLGFHMGTVATSAPRLMMEVGFGVSKPSKRRFHGEPVVR